MNHLVVLEAKIQYLERQLVGLKNAGIECIIFCDTRGCFEWCHTHVDDDWVSNAKKGANYCALHGKLR